MRNVIAGDLLQTILIQVQKTKVDVDLAMSALDKLLKSNELNFAFLGMLLLQMDGSRGCFLTISSCSRCAVNAFDLGVGILVQKHHSRQIAAKDEKDWFTNEGNIAPY